MVDTNFARRLRVALAWRGKSGADLARHLGVSVQAVAKYTQGKMLPSASRLMQIKDYLGVSVEYLMNDDASGQIDDVLSDLPPRLTTRQAYLRNIGGGQE